MKTSMKVALLAVLMTLPTRASTNAATNLPEDTRHMTQMELFKLYTNRSWIWSAGAAHYQNKRRVFSAYSNENGSPTVATGVWFLPWQGKVCFRANWRGADYNVKKTSCFGHRVAPNGVIWQRSEPDGEWYVFRSNPRKIDDEFNKLKTGNHVSNGFRRNENAIAK